jgi:transcriptional regulator with XRE-family HTH domain
MDFSDVSSRLKKRRAEQAPPVERNYEEINLLRARILGVLIRDARIAHGNTQGEVAEHLHVGEDEIDDWEYGRGAPSLPQLEMLAYFVDVPVSHFWSNQTFAAQQEKHATLPPAEDYNLIRDRVIGLRLMIARKEARLSQEELAKASNLSAAQVEAYEHGTQPVPFPVLTALASALRQSINYFLEETGRVGNWLALQEEYERFSKLSEEVRAFVVQPTNQPFIEIAMRLSQMPLKELRTVAEKILDITL